MSHLRAALLAVAAALIVAGCDGDAPTTTGSILEGPRVWDVGVGADGLALEEWLSEHMLLPADTVSMTIMVSGLGESRLALGVRDDHDQQLVDPLSSEHSPNRTLSGIGVAASVIPSATASLPLAGNYRVRAVRVDGVAATGAAINQGLTISAWTKRSGRDSAAPEVQELPLHLVFVGASPKAGAHLAAAIAVVTEIWREAGIDVKVASRTRLAGANGTAMERIAVDPARGSDTPQVGALFKLSNEVPDGPGLCLFFVADIAAGPGLGIWALSGGIPVPPVRGTVRSGIVVNASLVEQDPARAGQVMAHEIGHALGLFHTTEGVFLETQKGAGRQPLHDQIDDSPACPRPADVNGDETLTARECRAFDAGNLMFWAAGPSARHLTPGQADIARRSSLAR